MNKELTNATPAQGALVYAVDVLQADAANPALSQSESEALGDVAAWIESIVEARAADEH